MICTVFEYGRWCGGISDQAIRFEDRYDDVTIDVFSRCFLVESVEGLTCSTTTCQKRAFTVQSSKCQSGFTFSFTTNNKKQHNFTAVNSTCTIDQITIKIIIIIIVITRSFR